MKWLRLWSEMLDDEAVQHLSLSAFKLWIDLLCVTSENDGDPVLITELAFRTRRRLDRCLADTQKLCSAGLVTVKPRLLAKALSELTQNWRTSESGLTQEDVKTVRVIPRQWHRFQYESDDATARVKRYRERFKGVTGNASRARQNRGEERRVEESRSTVRPKPHFDEARLAFLSAKPNERVSRLVDLADSLGFERDGGKCAAVVKAMGHGQGAVDLMAAGLRAAGDKWEYVMKGVSNGRSKQAGRGNARGRQDSLTTTPADEAKANW